MFFLFPIFSLMAGTMLSKKILAGVGVGMVTYQVIENQLLKGAMHAGWNPIIRDKKLERLRNISKKTGIPIPENQDELKVFEFTREDVNDPTINWPYRVWFLTRDQFHILGGLIGGRSMGVSIQDLMMFSDWNVNGSWRSNSYLREVLRSEGRERYNEDRLLLAKARKQFREREQKEAV